MKFIIVVILLQCNNNSKSNFPHIPGTFPLRTIFSPEPIVLNSVDICPLLMVKESFTSIQNNNIKKDKVVPMLN
jgi:hypothetical protein